MFLTSAYPAVGQITVDTVAGGPTRDGPADEAKFEGPSHVIASGNGSIYVVETFLNQIRKISPDGIVSRLAGSGLSGNRDGEGVNADFWFPEGIAIDSSGNAYIADRGTNIIRKVTSSGIVTTFAGSGYANFADGPANEAHFNWPSDVAVDTDGNVYVADLSNSRIRKITPDGNVSTLAGSWMPGHQDGEATQAMFREPRKICVDASGNVYVADSGNFCIRKITPDGTVSTLAGSPSGYGYRDDVGQLARFGYPLGGICVDSENNVYVADRGNFRIRKITPNGSVSTFSGSGVYGYLDGTKSSARFGGLADVAIDAMGGLIVADEDNQRIRRVNPDGSVSTIAGTDTYGYTNGNGTIASFKSPRGLAMDRNGNLYIADQGNHRIRKISPNGDVNNYAGSGQTGNSDGPASTSRFYFPTDVIMDSDDNVIVADTYNHRIRKITPDGNVTTIAGSTAGFVNGDSTVAKFNRPSGLALANDGSILVADTNNHSVRVIDTNGIVTTLAGTGAS
ncbi:MAG: hypothetical protein ABII82_10955, partial [Verrucomicrobiota bacterium]